MDNFFKQFKNNLDNQPEPVFDLKDWNSLETQLTDKREKRPILAGLLWVLAPLFLMSLAANGFQYHQLNNAQQKMMLLENRFDSIRHNTVVIQSDTIYKIKTICKRDTLYRTKILRETGIVYLPSSEDTLNTIAIANKPALKDTKDLANIKTLKTAFLPIKKPSDLPNLDIDPIVFIPQKTLKQRLEILRPKAYSVGISAGLAYPMSDISSKPSGYAFGLQGAISFSPKVSFWADAHYMQLAYKTDRMNDAIGIPVIAPPSNDFSFNLVTINQPSLQYMAGLRYHFDSKKRLQPYLGLGYGAVTSLPYEVDYEFKNSSLGTVWEISQKINKRVTQWDFLLFDVGFEKRISQHYRWQIGANYRLKLSNSAQSYRLFGLKTGIFYDF